MEHHENEREQDQVTSQRERFEGALRRMNAKLCEQMELRLIMDESNDPPSEKRKMTEKIKETNELVASLRATLDTFSFSVVDEKAKKISLAGGGDPGKCGGQPQSAWTRIPSNLPKFRMTGGVRDPLEFLENFEAIMKANRFPIDRWIEVIPSLMGIEDRGMVEEFGQRTPTGTPEGRWTSFGLRFRNHFGSANEVHLRKKALYQARQGVAEEVQSYSDRFRRMVRLAFESLDAAFIRFLFVQGLLPKIRQHVSNVMDSTVLQWTGEDDDQAEYLETYPPVAQATLIALRFEASSAFGPAPGPVKVAPLAGGAGPIVCYGCHRPGHRQVDCPQPRPASPAAGPVSDKAHTKGAVCAFCKKEHHTEAQCWLKKRKGPRLALNAMDVAASVEATAGESTEDAAEDTRGALERMVPEEAAFFDLMADNVSWDDEMSLHAIEQSTGPSTAVCTPCTLNGVALEALVDSGASHSFVDPTVVTQLQIPVSGDRSSVDLGMDGCTGTVEGSVDVVLANGTTSVAAKLFVMPLVHGRPVVIGRDLFPLLGYALVGVPVKPPASAPPVNEGTLLKLQAEEQQGDEGPHTSTQDELEGLKTSVLPSTSGWETLRTAVEAHDAMPRGFCCMQGSELHLDIVDPIMAAAGKWVGQYPIPSAALPVVRQRVGKWVAEGTVVKAPPGTRWCFPLVAAPKKDAQGKLTDIRVCLDTRLLNSLITEYNFPLPKIRDLFDTLAGSVVFTTLDLQDSYNQFQLAPGDCPKASFVFEQTHWMFVGVPFGIRTMSSHFQRCMQELFHDCPYVAIYIDDLLIHSASLEEHAVHVAQTVKRLTEVCLKIRFKKCTWATASVRALGHIVTAAGTTMDPEKVATLLNWPPPPTSKAMERFLGAANFMREYVPHYAQHSAQMDAERRRGTAEISWTSDKLAAFDAFKDALVEAVFLWYPDFTRPFVVTVDASDAGLGAWLGQRDDNQGPEDWPARVLSCISRRLTPAEANYSATKKELLGVVWALARFRPYVWGRTFQVVTDHKALCFLFSKTHVAPMVQTWMETLLEYDFQVIHKAGAENVLSDALSRQYMELGAVELVPKEGVADAVDDTGQADGLDGATQLAVELEKRGKVAPPLAERPRLLAEIHEKGHYGVEASFKKLWEMGIWWPSLRADLREAMAECDECLRFNAGKPGFLPLEVLNTVAQPWHHVAMDCVTGMPEAPDGETVLLVVVDVFTRFVFLRSLKTKAQDEVAKALWEICCTVGFPRLLQTDNGKEFLNGAVKSVTELGDICHRLLTPYHPRANGVVERPNGTVTNSLKKMLMGALHRWPRFVAYTQYCYNLKIHSVTEMSPFSLMFARTECQPTMLAGGGDSDIQKTGADDETASVPGARQDQKRWMDRLERMVDIIYPSTMEKELAKKEVTARAFRKKFRALAKEAFPPGCVVMVKDFTRRSKWDPKYEGPFIVVRRKRSGGLVLKDKAGNLLGRDYTVDQVKVVRKDPSDKDSQESFYVRSILNHREVDKRVEYLVRWVDEKLEDSWESEKCFDDVAVIRRYWERRGVADGEPATGGGDVVD
jgi:hypothetical protein